MSPLIQLATAVAACSGLMLGFAIFRRIMRSSRLPAFLDNNFVSYSASLILTAMMMLSLMFVGFSTYNLIHSVVLSGVASLAVHIAVWAVARLIVPVRGERIVIGNTILGGGSMHGGLPAH